MRNDDDVWNNQTSLTKDTLKLRMFVMHVCMCVYGQTLNTNYTYDTSGQADQFVCEKGRQLGEFALSAMAQCLTKIY